MDVGGTVRFTVRVAEVRSIDGAGNNEAQASMGRAGTALKVVEGHLAERDFILGDRPTIADLSMCGYLFWPDEFGVSWSDYPNIGGWLERIAALPGWVHPYEPMPGHPLPDKK